MSGAARAARAPRGARFATRALMLMATLAAELIETASRAGAGAATVPSPAPRADAAPVPSAAPPSATRASPPAASAPAAASATSSKGAAAACFPPVAPAVDGPGVLDPFHVPSDEAKRLNSDALGAYRQGRWDEARARYRAAEAADPAFLAPALNVACSFVRQERLDEALGEVRRLLARAFLPWSDEILTAADLGALKVGPQGKQLRSMLDDARRAWATGLAGDVFFVARMRAPLRLDAAAGDAAFPSAAPRILVLGPRQEAFAWSPRTLRYRQLTSEQGRVLALGLSRDRRRLAVVTAEKLVITPGTEPALRGVAIKELDLGTLAPVAEARATADVRRLEIIPIPIPGGGFAYRLDGPSPGRGPTVTVKDGRLEPSVTPRSAMPVCTLTGHGVAPAPGPTPLPAACQGTARDFRSSDGPPGVEVTAGAGTPADSDGRGKSVKNAAPRTISGPFGGGLCGLLLP